MYTPRIMCAKTTRTIWCPITHLLFHALHLMTWLSVICAYPGGAPDKACDSMFPSGHPASAQRSPPPYKIFLPKSTYKAGETMNIDVYGENTYFAGLYVQARHVGCHVNATRTIGVFTATDPRLETRHCFGIVHSTVTHTSSLRKDSVSFFWTAPVIPAGHVVIRATIVKNLTTFWVGVESRPLVDLKSEDALTCPQEKQTKTLQESGNQTNLDGQSHAYQERLNLDQEPVTHKTDSATSKQLGSNASRFMHSTITLLTHLAALHVILFIIG